MDSFEELSKIAKAGDLTSRPLPRILTNVPREKAAAAVRAFVLLTVAIMARFQSPPPEESIAWIFGVGALYVLATTFLPMVRWQGQRSAMLLSIVDIGFITALIYSTGGVRSEYYVLYYLPILHAAMRLNFRDAIGSSVLAAVCYMFAGVMGIPGGEPAPNLFARVFTFGVSSILLAGFFAYMCRESRTYKQLSQWYQKANEDKAQFVSMASHELRTPLTAIMGFSDLLCYTQVDEEKEQEYLKIIKDQTERLARLIENILEMSRVEAGRIKVKKEPVKLNEAAARVAEKASGANDNVKIQIAESLPAASADVGRVEQILRIVLENAISYCPKKPVVISAWSEAGNGNGSGRLCVQVKDHGPGIPEGDLGHIFDAFYCASNSNGRKGTTLSLAIARGMAKLQGGELSAESVPGKGATFYLRLPIWQEATAATEEPEAAIAGSHERADLDIVGSKVS